MHNVTRPGRPDRIARPGQPEDVVLGARLSQAAPQQEEAAALPFTGGTVIPLLAAALALIAAGLLLTKRMRARR